MDASGPGARRLSKLEDVERLPEALQNIMKTQAMKVTASAVGTTMSNAIGRLSIVRSCSRFPLSEAGSCWRASGAESEL